MRLLACLYVLIIVLAGCKKQNQDICSALPSSGGGPIGWNYTSQGNANTSPSFNPNNSNQFAFIQNTKDSVILCIYDMQTKQIKHLYSGNFFYKPDWGVNHWILFNINNDIYKIKESGDSLTRLTYSGISVGGAWFNDASKYFYTLYAGYGNGYLIANPNGQVTDSFNIAIADTAEWLDTAIIIVNPGSGFITYGGEGRVPKLISCNIDVASYSTSAYVSSSSFIWADWTGIYVTNKQSQQTTKLKLNCNSITYLFPSYSFQSNKVIWSRQTQIPISTQTLNVTTNIVMMNPDGSGEQVINIP